MPREPESPAPSRRLTISASAYRRVVLVALALLCIIVVTGAAVRLTGSGLGCSTWPNCEPDDFIAVGEPNQAIEQLNRLFTGAVSIGVVAAVLGALRRVPYRRDLVWLAWGLVAGVVAQIVLGGITVLSHLHPVAVAGHFVLSQVLVVNATVLLWRAGRDPGPRHAVVRPRSVATSRVALVFGAAVIAVTGPMLTGSGPHAGDMSEEVRRFDLAVSDAARVHAVSAWAFLAAVVWTMVVLARDGAPPGVLRRAQVLLALIVAQGALGYVQYDRGIPAELVAAHIVGATSIVIAATWFHLGLFRTDAGGDGTARGREAASASHGAPVPASGEAGT